MWLIVLEALAALALLLFLVWWTMFSGRRGGERPADAPVDPSSGPSSAPTSDPSSESPGADRDDTRR